MTVKSSVNTTTVLIFVAGILLGFVVGFALANDINRKEQDKLRAELAEQKAGGATKTAEPGAGAQVTNGDADQFPTLTEEQLKNAVAKADESPGDVELQKKVGQALYVYAWQTGTASILSDVARILKRAHEADPKDYKTTVMAGDAHFLIARGGDAKHLVEARKLYEAALASKPDDVVVRTSFGLTYFYDRPSNPQRAIREYRRALQSDSRHELPLQSLAAALIETEGFDEAGKRLDELEKVNPANGELASLRARLEQKRNASKDKP
ncbi:MAG TPA: tetratricopeptide repeat protein [Pyrinomonadaceae bacterium]|nr:tetratricopeptide repeat protein [Pyrinomonadaceae bacterium]